MSKEGRSSRKTYHSFITTGFAAFGGPHGVVAVTIPGEAVDEKGKKVLRKGVPLNQRGCYECRPEDFVQIKGILICIVQHVEVLVSLPRPNCKFFREISFVFG